MRRWRHRLVAALNALGIRTRRATPAERLGRLGEKQACRYLRRRGYTILGRNLVVPHIGEADIVCQSHDGETIVLVEVKSRTLGPTISDLQRPAEAQVNADKQTRLAALMRHLSKHNNWHDHARRIDVIAIDFDDRQRVLDLRHHVGAVR